MRYRPNALIPSEFEEQCSLVEWADQATVAGYHVGEFLFHIPNGSQRRKLTGAKLKLAGVRPGVPDLMLAIPAGDYHGLFIELKRIDGGYLSPVQRQWITRLIACGYRVEIAEGWIEAKKIIENYLTDSGNVI